MFSHAALPPPHTRTHKKHPNSQRLSRDFECRLQCVPAKHECLVNKYIYTCITYYEFTHIYVDKCVERIFLCVDPY